MVQFHPAGILSIDDNGERLGGLLRGGLYPMAKHFHQQITLQLLQVMHVLSRYHRQLQHASSISSSLTNSTCGTHLFQQISPFQMDETRETCGSRWWSQRGECYYNHSLFALADSSQCQNVSCTLLAPVSKPSTSRCRLVQVQGWKRDVALDCTTSATWVRY
jgi:hypothetical protein